MTDQTNFYMIHDNMDRPFKISVYPNKIDIYRHPPYDGTDSDFDEDDTDQYTELVGSINDYIEVFIGEDSDPENLGNTILIHTAQSDESNQYTMIDGEIFTFRIKDTILELKSPVGNSDVPYPYAVGKKNVYVLWNKKYFPKKYWNPNEDPDNVDDKYQEKLLTKIIHQRDR